MNRLNGLQQAVSRGYLRAGVAAATLIPALAFATPTDPFDTALASATTKVGDYAAALVGLSAVAVVFMIAMKYVKKLPRAS
jgi:hypothetical protein